MEIQLVTLYICNKHSNTTTSSDTMILVSKVLLINAPTEEFHHDVVTDASWCWYEKRCSFMILLWCSWCCYEWTCYWGATSWWSDRGDALCRSLICYCYQGNVVTEMPYHYVVSYMFNGYIDVSIKVLLHDVVTAVPYRVVVIKISSDVVTEVLLNNVVWCCFRSCFIMLSDVVTAALLNNDVWCCYRGAAL